MAWIADLVGFPQTGGGLLVSGGNMANIVCLMAARSAQAEWDVQTSGVAGALRVYGSTETHTWIQKVADLSGMGTDAVNWVDRPPSADQGRRATTGSWRDLADGNQPIMVAGSAGTVSSGAVDPLPAIAEVCRDMVSGSC